MSPVSKPIQAFSFNPLDPIGSILDSAFDSIEKSLVKVSNDVQNLANSIFKEAAKQTLQVIASLKGAYQESLQKTYEAVDSIARKNIDRIRDLVKELEKDTVENLSKITDTIADIVKFSPLSNWWIPLLKDVNPEFFAVESDGNLGLVTFEGNFAYADQPGNAVFTLNNQTYSPSSNTTKQLKFLVNLDGKDPSVKMHAYSYIKGTLSVKWNNGYWGWPSWTTSSYNTLLGLLPACIGKLTIVYTKAAHEIKKVFETQQIEVPESTIPDHWQLQWITFTPESDYHVIQGTSSVKWLKKYGEHIKADIDSDDHDKVVCRYTRLDASGIFQVYFDQIKSVPETERTEEIDNLSWGKKVVARPEVGEKIKKVLFRTFQGDDIELQPRTDDSNSFISLREFDNTLEIRAKKASELNSHDFSFLYNKVKVLSKV